MRKRRTKPGAAHGRAQFSKLHRRIYRATSYRASKHVVRMRKTHPATDEKLRPLVFRMFPEQTRATGALKRHEKRAAYLAELNG